MEIKTFYCNPLRECSYVAWDDTLECVIIDPGFFGDRERQRLEDFVTEKSLRPVKVLLTHGHFDHMLSLDYVTKRWKAEVLMHPADKVQLVNAVDWCHRLGLAFDLYEGPFTDLKDGDTVSFGHTVLKVIGTPGHTEGCVCFLDEPGGVLFSGDTLFAGSIGRTDHPGGDYERLMDSLNRKLMALDGDIKVLPGHGGATTIGYERATNPFLQPF